MRRRKMNKQNIKKEQTEMAKKRHEDSIKYMYFSRYLLIRYIITIFFFTNLMWLIIDVNYHSVLGIIVSAIMTIYSGIASIEQLTKMHNRKREVPISKVYLEVQAALNLLFIILTFLPLGKYLFPFIENQSIMFFMTTLFLADILLCVWSEYRIHQIMNDQDRYHKVIETFKKHQQ